MEAVARVNEVVARPVSPARAWWSVFVFTVALMLNFLDRQVMTLLVTPIKRDLHLSDTQMSLLIGFTFALFYVIVGLPLSRLVDRGTRKYVVGAGIAVWSVMTAACGLAQSFATLALARMGVGIGESCNAPGTYSMTTDMFPREKLGRAISVIGIGTVAGQGIALLVGGTVIVALVKLGTVALPVVGTLHAWQLTFSSSACRAYCGRCCCWRRCPSRRAEARRQRRRRPASAQLAVSSESGEAPICRAYWWSE